MCNVFRLSCICLKVSTSQLVADYQCSTSRRVKLRSRAISNKNINFFSITIAKILQWDYVTFTWWMLWNCHLRPPFTCDQNLKHQYSLLHLNKLCFTISGCKWPQLLRPKGGLWQVSLHIPRHPTSDMCAKLRKKQKSGIFRFYFQLWKQL